MSKLQSALQKYLSVRRGLGYKFYSHEKLLKSFVGFMGERDAHLITNKLALEWATLRQDRPRAQALRLISYMDSLDICKTWSHEQKCRRQVSCQGHHGRIPIYTWRKRLQDS